MSQSIESLCKGVCQVEVFQGEEICIGCGRSLTEIGEWITSNREERLRIVTEAAMRLRLLQQRDQAPA